MLDNKGFFLLYFINDIMIYDITIHENVHHENNLF